MLPETLLDNSLILSNHCSIIWGGRVTTTTTYHETITFVTLLRNITTVTHVWLQLNNFSAFLG